MHLFGSYLVPDITLDSLNPYSTLRSGYEPHFTAKQRGSERLSNLPRVTARKVAGLGFEPSSV